MPDGANPHPMAITIMLGAAALIAVPPAAAQYGREREVTTCRDNYRECFTRPYRDHRDFMRQERRWDERRDEYRLRQEMEWDSRREFRRGRQW